MNLFSFLSSRSQAAAHLLLLLGLATLVLVLPAGLWDVRGPDEGRYTQVAKELLQRDNWFALTVMDRPYDQKPPLAFWLLALTLKATGGEPVSWALRMPSVLAAIGTLIITYLLGRRFAGPAAGFLSGLFLLTSLAFLDDAPTVELNMLYTFFTTASLSVWLFNMQREKLTWPQWLGMWGLLTCAFMVKGPVAILIVLSAVAYTAWSTKSWQPLKAIRPIAGMALLLACIGGWLYAQSIAYGPEFIENQVSGETVDRFLKGDHGNPFWYYFPRLFTALMGPWAFFLIAALVKLWKNRGQNEHYTRPLIGWIAFPFIIFVLAHGKRVPYLLPLLPAMCLLAGIYVSRYLSPYPMSKGYLRLLVFIMVLLVSLLTLLGIIFTAHISIIHSPRIDAILDFDAISPLVWFLAAGLVGMFLFLFIRSHRTWAEGCLALSLTILVIHLLDFTVIRPAMEPVKSAREFTVKVDALMKSAGEDKLLTLLDLAEPEFHVYAHYDVVTGKKSQIDLRSTTIPVVLALKDKEIQTSGPEAIAAGYHEVFDVWVTRDPVKVYLRKEPLTEN